MILSALLLLAGGAGGRETGERGTAVAAEAAGAPHFGQNLAPDSTLLPQELQNAIAHLAAQFAAGVYLKSAQNDGGFA
jgi:hypothetical protein